MNKFEKGPEQIPTKESVMEVIKSFEENTVIVRELEDEKGLYLLEANIKGEKPGEYTQYQFVREGIFQEAQKTYIDFQINMLKYPHESNKKRKDTYHRK